MKKSNNQLLRYDGLPKEIQQLDDFRKRIKDFKNEQGMGSNLDL